MWKGKFICRLDSFITGYDKAECVGSNFPKMAATTALVPHVVQQCDLPILHQEGRFIPAHPGIWVGPMVAFISRILWKQHYHSCEQSPWLAWQPLLPVLWNTCSWNASLETQPPCCEKPKSQGGAYIGPQPPLGLGPCEPWEWTVWEVQPSGVFGWHDIRLQGHERLWARTTLLSPVHSQSCEGS